MKYVKETGYYGMEYVTAYLRVSSVHPEHGPLIHAQTFIQVDQQVCAELIKQGVPIRGIELRFMRKTLGLSYRELGNMLELSHSAVAKWEKEKKKQRLEPINEAALRSLFAQLMKISIPGWFDSLKGTGKPPRKIEVRAA